MAGGILAGLGGIGTALTILKASGPAIETIGGIVNRLIPDPAARENAALEIQKLVTSERVQAAQSAETLAKEQAAMTAASVERGGWSGAWRDAIGWCCVGGLFYQWFVQPSLEWSLLYLSAWKDINFPPPPILDVQQVYAMIATLLGVTGLDLVKRVLPK